MKQVAGSVKLELAQYREMEAFAQFASDLDASTQKLLSRGARLTELLKQPQYSPLTTSEHVVVLFSGVKGYLDDVAVKSVTEYEAGLLSALRSSGSQILADIEAKQKLDDDLEKALHDFIGSYTSNFNASAAKAA